MEVEESAVLGIADSFVSVPGGRLFVRQWCLVRADKAPLILLHDSLVPLLADVHCPVLVLHGEEDEFGSPAFPQAIAGGVSGSAQMALLPACGHVPHREREAEVLALVKAFLSRHPID